MIRSVVVGKGNTRPNQLHHRTSQIVKAHTQAVIIQYLEPMLTEEEADIYRRGRNAKSATMAKMQRWQITVRQRGWRHWWDICI